MNRITIFMACLSMIGCPSNVSIRKVGVPQKAAPVNPLKDYRFVTVQKDLYRWGRLNCLEVLDAKSGKKFNLTPYAFIEFGGKACIIAFAVFKKKVEWLLFATNKKANYVGIMRFDNIPLDFSRFREEQFDITFVLKNKQGKKYMEGLPALVHEIVLGRVKKLVDHFVGGFKKKRKKARRIFTI